MKLILILALILFSKACWRTCEPPKFYNGQVIQLVDGKAKGTIIGTQCSGAGPCTCVYKIQLNSRLEIDGLVGEFEIEEVK